MSKRKKKGRGSYQDVLARLQGMNTGSPFWSPKVGRSVIRVLPPMGEMEMFVKEVGIHRADDKNHFCLDLSTDGDKECPACEVNEELYQAGENDAAADFRFKRKFYMNVIVRGEESAGPRIFTPGITVFGGISSLIQDPDYGEVYDIEDGTDIVIDRTGTTYQDTKYQVRPVKNANTPLSDDPDQVDEWLDEAKDLETYVLNKLSSYDELAKITGADVYLDGSVDDDEDEYDDDVDDEEEQEETASATIQKRLARRQQAKGASSRRRVRR